MTTRLLCNFDGPGITEDSAGLTTTVVGSAALSSAQSRFGGSSLSIPDVGSRVQVSGGTFDFSADFTVELWVWMGVSSGTISTGLVTRGNTSAGLIGVNGSRIVYTEFPASQTNSTYALPVSEWVHLALTKLGGVLRLFAGGNRVLEIQDGTTRTETIATIGNSFNTGTRQIYIDGVRIVTGAALYTQAFTPPTTPPTVAYSTLREYNLAAQLGVGELMPLNPNTTLPNQPVVFRFDPQLGTATLTGTVKTLGSPNQPVARRVILIEEQSGNVIRETVSDPLTGVYTFSELLPQARYTVLAYDHTGYYRAVIADNLSAT